MAVTQHVVHESIGQELLPALVQCFGIILIGYILGRCKILSSHEVKGLYLFIHYFSLPTLIFTSVATISFINVNWTFIASIFVAKVAIFITVVLMTMVITKPTHVGKAGLYAITATQSNDFALGYPLLTSLYRSEHTDYPQYIYFLAPIQLLILNPIGFLLLEMHKQKQTSTIQQNAVLSVLKGVIKNQVVAATLLGIAWNFAFNHTLPHALTHLLDSISSTFPALALFLLGNNMVGKIGALRGHFLITPTLLVVAKILVLPLIIQKVTTHLLNRFSMQDIQDLSSFGFLYGTIPCAPTVFIFACQYETSVDVIASTMVSSTLLAAPLMVTSANMISLARTGFENLTFYLTQAISYTSAFSFFCCSWLLAAFVIGKRCQRVTHGATTCLIFAQFIASIGGILWFANYDSKVLFYSRYLMSIGGIFSTRMLTAFLAILLSLLQWRSLCFIIRIRRLMTIIGFTVSFGLAILLASGLLGYAESHSKSSPNFELGHIQLVCTFIITSVSFLTISICLIILFRYTKVGCQNLNASENEQTEPLLNDELISDNICDDPIGVAVSADQYKSENADCLLQTSDDFLENACNIQKDKIPSETIHHTKLCDIEDICCQAVGNNSNEPSRLEDTSNFNQISVCNLLCDTRFYCNTNHRRQCLDELQNYQTNLSSNETGIQDNHQIIRHIVLLLLLSFSMLISITVCLWKLFMETPSGIFIEFEFLDLILCYGQGIICFITFGFDSELTIYPCVQKWRQIRYGRATLVLPDLATLSATVTHICKQFETYHYNRCLEQVATDKRVGETVHCNAFTGCDLVDWLIRVGLACERKDAEKYGEHLLLGRLIEHINQQYHFRDNSHIYRFIL